MLRIKQIPWNCQLIEYEELSKLLKEAFDNNFSLDYNQFTYALWKREQASIYTFVLLLDEHIIGTASVIIEQKLIKETRTVAHIEEVAIKKDLQGQGYGRYLMERVKGFCKEMDCRKIILDCSDKNIPFYEKCGFSVKERQMRLDLS